MYNPTHKYKYGWSKTEIDILIAKLEMIKAENLDMCISTVTTGFTNNNKEK